MIRSDRLRAGKLHECLWIFFLLFIVSDGVRYDKCVTKDGKRGVCVINRYCREASKQELRPCEGDDEHICCPIQPTRRSAQTFPPTKRPQGGDRYPLEPEEKQIHPEVFRELDRDDRLNKTPLPSVRPRPPVRHNSNRPNERPSFDAIDKFEEEKLVPYESQGSSRNRPGKSRPNLQNRPPVRPTDYDPRDSPNRHTDRFNPEKDELEYSRPPRGILHGTNPEIKKDDVGSANPARRVNYDRVPTQKNWTTNDSSKLPIRFPGTSELSLPKPKVPACGVKPYDLFIAGGQESTEHEWPWMTSIFRRYPDARPKTFMCGGSLINTKYVLTAAHCFVNNYVILPASSFVVRLGSHFLESGEEYTVSNLTIHHKHSGSDYSNDIALVRLGSEVYITDKIAPICLPYPEMIRDDFVGKLATVAGWGDTAFGTSGTRILQHVTIPIVSGEECFAAYSRVKGAAFLARGSDHIICAGLEQGGKDACLGDSGGPLMMRMPDDRWIIIGIVSLGYKCAEPGFPGVYTRVTHYMSWINTNMKSR